MKKFAIILFVFALTGVFAQKSQQEFGQNRVQYKRYKWLSISTTNFTLYYYAHGNQAAHNAARILESSFDEVVERTGYAPRRRVEVFLYNSIGDYQQSNTGLSVANYTGGEAQLMKSRLEIPFNGNQVEFRKELKYELSHLFINLLLYGGNFRDAVQNSYLLDVPKWVTSGAARYIGYGEDGTMLDLIEQRVFQGKMSPYMESGNDATLVGQSVWAYANEHYGKDQVSNVLNLTRIMRSESVGFTSSTGVPYERFLKDWRAYYERKFSLESSLKDTLKSEMRVRAHNPRHQVYTDVACSKDSSLIAYAINNAGFYKVYVYNEETNKTKLVHFGGSKTLYNTYDQSYPQLSWRSETELSILTTNQGRPFFRIKDVNRRLWSERKRFKSFDKILSHDYCSQNDDVVLLASKKGQSDLYIYDYKKNRAKQLTKDLFDEISPVFVPGSTEMLFASNRRNDTLRSEHGEIDQVKDEYYLFAYKWGSQKAVLTRLTNRPLKIRSIRAVGKRVFLSIEDSAAQAAVYEFNRETQELKKVSNVHSSVRLFDIDANGELVAKLSVNGNELLFKDLIIHKDGLSIDVSPVVFSLPEVADPVTAILELNIDDYQFESTPRLEREAGKGPKELKFSYPTPYRNAFGVDYFVMTPNVVFPLGFGITLAAHLQETLANHQLSANLFAGSDLRTSSYTFQYEYLERRLDHRIRVEKLSVPRFNADNAVFHVYDLSKMEYSLSLPFSNALRVSAKLNYQNTKLTDFDPAGINSLNHYTGVEAGFVFDNTRKMGLNMIRGARIKGYVRSVGALSDNVEGFRQALIDARGYTPLFRHVVVAYRGSTGAFGGASPKSFWLEGQDSWLFYKTADHSANDDDPLALERSLDNSDFLLSQTVTNLRGFDLVEQYGTRFVLANAEVRWPVVKSLYQGPVNSPFLRNFQLTGFFDWGAAWTGASPFRDREAFNSTIIDSPSFSGQVTKYGSPFLYSYGTGLRSKLSGYYMKFDLIWAVQDRVHYSPRVNVSLGYDF